MSIKHLRSYVCPSVLNADLSNLGSECQKLLKAGADCLHLDVMDGHFVPNLSFGHPVVGCLRETLGNEPFLDVHLMVANPEQWLEPMRRAGADQFTFHWEAVDDKGGDSAVYSLIDKIRAANLKVGLAIKPKTAVEKLLPFAEKIDNALVMTVEPGFGGQEFMEDMMDKVKVIRSKHPILNIQVDGGINASTAEVSAKAGANSFVAGTAIIKQPDWSKVIEEIRRKTEIYMPLSHS